jgi:hypothetical protein
MIEPSPGGLPVDVAALAATWLGLAVTRWATR